MCEEDMQLVFEFSKIRYQRLYNELQLTCSTQ